MTNPRLIADNVSEKHNLTEKFKRFLLEQIPDVAGCERAAFIDDAKENLGYKNCIYHAILRLEYKIKTGEQIDFDFKIRISAIRSDTIELMISGRIIKREIVYLTTSNSQVKNYEATNNFFDQFATLIAREINFN